MQGQKVPRIYRKLLDTNLLIDKQVKVVKQLIKKGDYESAGLILEHMGVALKERSRCGMRMPTNCWGTGRIIKTKN